MTFSIFFFQVANFILRYRDSYTNGTLSIKCHIDEWYSPGKRVMIKGTFSSMVSLASFLAGALGLPVAIGTGMAKSILYAGIIYFAGDMLATALETEVIANVVEQRIYGRSTSHPNKPIGDLGDARSIYVTSSSKNYPGENFYEGYTASKWGTAGLGRMMFWKVFGIEYIPTSWTGVDG